jgi:hypothetical protein
VARGVAGLVTAGSRESWTTGELAPWARVPATHSIIRNPSVDAKNAGVEGHSSYDKAILIAYKPGWTIA